MLWIAALFGIFLLGIPISFSLGITTLIGLAGAGLPMEVLVQRMFTGVDNFAFVAIPLFILAGNLMAVGGISKRITDFSEALVGHWPGGLGMVAIVASMIFAAVTGSAIAATAAIGALLISEMISKGYSKAYAASLVATAGSIGPIIPPSIPLVVYGVIVGSSIAKLFMGGIIPGILMGVFLMIANWMISKRRGYVGRETKSSSAELRKGLKDAILALLMPVIIIGGIVGGIFTPTESASIAVAYSLFLGTIVYRELSWKDITRAFIEAAITTGIIFKMGSPYGNEHHPSHRWNFYRHHERSHHLCTPLPASGEDLRDRPYPFWRNGGSEPHNRHVHPPSGRVSFRILRNCRNLPSGNV